MKPLLSLIVTLGLVGSAWAAAPGEPGGIPPNEQTAREVLNKSPRHGEWVEIKVEGAEAPLKSYIVYPERKDKAPVVVVIHEIFGESDWVRSVADQLAADGFIAIAPDMLSGHGPNGGGTDSLGDRQGVTRAVMGLKRDEVMRDINAVRDYGMKLPAASDKSATIGFCWGGGQSFAYATVQPGLNAAVVYYGTPPSKQAMEQIKCPVLGCYGGNDNRVSSTVPAATAQMKELGKSYDPHIFEGAGHGFLRGQEQSEANAKAAKEAWTLTIAFLKEHTK